MCNLRISITYSIPPPPPPPTPCPPHTPYSSYPAPFRYLRTDPESDNDIHKWLNFQMVASPEVIRQSSERSPRVGS
ncbi:hypothetical protein RRG08_009172 [Elysia crispata]|uniref:Uncharacterized protein n=1 Tax=Elysia crispata TaxID=231223 RepID=A0AAE0ZPC5_9GAST|nr:hypothetical protein RRG08_009172 [Elysia crispata]